MFSHRYRYLFVLGLSLYTFLNTVLCSVYTYFHITISWYYALLTIFGITLIAWESNRVMEPFFRKKFLTPRTKIRFLAFFYLGGNVVTMGAVLLMVWLVGALLHQHSWEENRNPLKLNIIYGGLINLFFHLLNSIFFFFKEYRRQWAEAEELRRNHAQAQLQLIKSQINPHFLFNNLNVLSGMVIKDNPDANQFIEQFSKVYRYILNNQDKELVELQTELDFIQPYIFLLEKRFDSGLSVSITIPESYKSCYVVPAALQMVIENAIKHNIVSRQKPLYIIIQATSSETLTVTNNVQPRKIVEPSTRIGLKNISKRYELISGRTVDIRSSEAIFEVHLPLLTLNNTLP